MHTAELVGCAEGVIQQSQYISFEEVAISVFRQNKLLRTLDFKCIAQTTLRRQEFVKLGERCVYEMMEQEKFTIFANFCILTAVS